MAMRARMQLEDLRAQIFIGAETQKAANINGNG